jgi:ABC-type dipeptide/oligopeptide/nickel transport system permease subunit
MLVALTSCLIGETLGFAWGVACGYIGGRFDLVSQRIIEVMMAFPALILALLLMVSMGPGLRDGHRRDRHHAAFPAPRASSDRRSLAAGPRRYVEAARGLGASNSRIMVRHIAPQCVAPMLVLISVNLGGALFLESALSFLGVGIPPPDASWGNMLGGVLAEAFKPSWWLVAFPEPLSA